jgi:hypothetical protein
MQLGVPYAINVGGPTVIEEFNGTIVEPGAAEYDAAGAV